MTVVAEPSDARAAGTIAVQEAGRRRTFAVISHPDAGKSTLTEAGCVLGDVVKTMVWLRERSDFPGFNAVYGEYFPNEPPARSAVVSELLVDVRVEVEVVAYRPLGAA